MGEELHGDIPTSWVSQQCHRGLYGVSSEIFLTRDTCLTVALRYQIYVSISTCHCDIILL
jgi:hypothetical protein